MTIRVEVISGLQAKAPAAILVTTPSRRILLDAGGTLETGESAAWPIPSDLDAVLLSHDHVDHVGGVARLPPGVPIYCTEVTARALPGGLKMRPIPVRGQFRLGELLVTTGSSGHAYGGVWFHLDLAGGLFYSGDVSLESSLFHFDPPPKAALALVDASYGLNAVSQPERRAGLQAELDRHGPILFPVPPSGRAVEMALWLVRQGRTAPALDAACRRMLEGMAEHDDGSLLPGVQDELRRLAVMLPALTTDQPLLLAADPDGQGGTVGELRRQPGFSHHVLFTGHLNEQARRQHQAGEAGFCRWNVHPTRHCLRRLAGMLACERLVPLFTPIDSASSWQQALAVDITLNPVIEITE